MDKSSWDWTVTEDMIIWARQFILELPVSPPQWWKDAVELRFEMLYRRAVYKFQDGTEVEQDVWGIQKSGCLLTLILNSVWQSMLHYDACISLGWQPLEDQPITMGDDTLQRWDRDEGALKDYADMIRSRGPILDEAKVQHWIEFAGFAVVGNSCIPAYWRKHFYNLMYAEHPVDTLHSYQILYSHYDEMFEWVEKELVKLPGGEPFPRMWCRQVMDDEGSTYYLN